jgi:hypothetical protein
MFFNRDNMERQELDEGIVRYIYSGNGMQLVEYHFPPSGNSRCTDMKATSRWGWSSQERSVWKWTGMNGFLVPGIITTPPSLSPTGPGHWMNPRYCWTSFHRPGTT